MAFLFTFAAFALLIWALVMYRELNLTRGLGIVLLIGSCFGHAFFNRSVGPMPITADRLLWALAGLHLIVGLILGKVRPIRFGLTEALLIGFLGFIGFNLGITNFGLDGMQPVAIFLFFIVMPAGCYLIARQGQFREIDYQWMIKISIVFGLYLALTAVAECRGLSFAVFPRYISSVEFPEFLGRGRGPFLNPVVNGMVMIGCMVAGLTNWPRYRHRGKWLLVMFVGVMLLGCYATLTRTVWISAGFALGLTVVLNIPKERRVACFAGVALLGGLVIGGAWDQLKAFKRDKDVSVEEMAQSASLRPLLATVAGRMIGDRPLLGHGFAQYRDNSAPYHFWGGGTAPIQMALPYVQHNLILSLLVDIGIIGTLLFLGLIGRFTYEAWQVWMRRDDSQWQRNIGLLMLVGISSYLINGMFHDVLIIPMVNMFLFSLAGLVANVRLKNSEAKRRSESRQEWPAIAVSQAQM